MAGKWDLPQSVQPSLSCASRRMARSRALGGVLVHVVAADVEFCAVFGGDARLCVVLSLTGAVAVQCAAEKAVLPTLGEGEACSSCRHARNEVVAFGSSLVL